jgi:putative nucleotidyltransferase with HDIG domain
MRFLTRHGADTITNAGPNNADRTSSDHGGDLQAMTDLFLALSIAEDKASTQREAARQRLLRRERRKARLKAAVPLMRWLFPPAPVPAPDTSARVFPDTCESLTDAAAGIAHQCLAEHLPQRWAHTKMVAAEASRLARILEPGVADILVAAAWLHDIGYAHPETGFHPIDGARYAQRAGFPSLIVELIAYHTGAEFEAAERGLDNELAAYARPAPRWLSILSCADLCTGPHGEVVAPVDRIAEILERYPVDHPVHRAVSRSGDQLHADAIAIEQQARETGPRRWAEICGALEDHNNPMIREVKAAATEYGCRIAS